MCYTIANMTTKISKVKKLPLTFKPLLWSLRWRDLDVQKDKEDIIVNVVNDGTLEQWRWLIATYGKETIRSVLRRRLITEFHPESRRLASVVFDVRDFRHAR